MVKAIDELTYSLVTRAGFVDTFWRVLVMSRTENPEVTHQDVYEYLEGLYEEEFGSPQFRTFEAFRKWRDRYQR